MSIGLEALAITDHDTFAGYERAEPLASAAGLDLICGIELSTKFQDRSVHLLGYFPGAPPALDFKKWLGGVQKSRRDRNLLLIDRLRSLGIDIALDEVEAKGRSMTGRPHFARVMMEKGYVASIEQAFSEYLNETGQAYVFRDEPGLAEAIAQVLAGGGVPSLAHPIRLSRKVTGGHNATLEQMIGEMRDMGLQAMEAFHSDHKPADVERYLGIARELNLAVTGGSDFHGGNKPKIQLGSGYQGNLNVPRWVLDALRGLADGQQRTGD